MRYYLELAPIHHDPIFRLQSDYSWRKVEHLEPIKDGDYTSANPEEIIALQLDNQQTIIEGTTWKISPTSGSLFNETPSLYYTSYLIRSESIPAPKLNQLILVISEGNDKKHNRLVLNTKGMFELRSIDDDDRTFKDPSIVIRHESFQAGNGYVGRKAAQDVDYVKLWYADSLEAWIHHLKSGQCNVYSDLHTDVELDELERIVLRYSA